MANNERTSARVASIATRILNGGKFSIAELKAVAASALTQTRDKPKKRKAKKAGRELL